MGELLESLHRLHAGHGGQLKRACVRAQRAVCTTKGNFIVSKFEISLKTL